MRTLPINLVMPERTVSRAGAFLELFREGRGHGDRCFLIHGGAVERAGMLGGLLAAIPEGMEIGTWRHPGGEPTLAQVERALGEVRRFAPDWIAGVGGGSVLDVAKACAGLINADMPVQFYHDGAPLPTKVLPYVAVPTTAGTGSEATAVSVLTNENTGVKKSFRHPGLMAKIVILAPELLATCPPAVMAASGMDAFVQAIESYVSKGATRFTDMLAIEGLQLVNSSLERGVTGRNDVEAFTNLLQGSYLAGCALSNARLGLVHGLAHPLGARFHLAHGLVCAVCLPLVLEFNRDAMGFKYARLAEILGCDPVERARNLMASLGIASPFAGRRIDDLEVVIDETLASGSTAANPRPVRRDDVRRILDGLFRGSTPDT